MPTTTNASKRSRDRSTGVGIFDRLKRGASAKANAALDRAIDPAKQLDQAILDLEAGRQKALAELVSYKATAKTIARHRLR